MKLAKKVSGLLALGLVASSAALAVGSAPAQAATATISYRCGLPNGATAGALNAYTGVDLAISVTPDTVTQGNNQTIRIDLGGNGTTGTGNSPFNNGPFAASTSATYQAIFSISINDAAPINVVASTLASTAAANAPAFPNGITGSITVAKPEGVYNVKLQNFFVDSLASGGAWSGTGTPSDPADGENFDSICNAGTTQANVVGNNAPPQTPPTLVPASYLQAAETAFTVEAPLPEPQNTVTTVTASPQSPQTVGTGVTFTATVTSVTGTPVGSVQFKNGGSNLGSPVTLSGGSASTTTTALAVGTRSITAVYTSSDTVGADGFLNSTSAPLSYIIRAAEAPATTPPATQEPTGPSTDDKSKTASLNAYCEVVSKAASPGNPSVTPYKGWKTTLTVSPGAAQPGNKVKVTVSLDDTPNNGPVTTLDAGAYRFQPSITFQGKATSFTNGTVSGPEVPPSQPIFASSQLPLKASGTITLPDSEGSFPVKLQYLNFNNIKGSSNPTEGQKDIFDNTCNASTSPNDSPKAFNSPSVSVVSDKNAAASDVSGEEGNSSDTGGVLAATGPKQTLLLGLLALLALQAGAILWVRSQRAAPVRRRY